MMTKVQTRQSINTYALLALITGILCVAIGFGIVPIVLGFVGLRKSRSLDGTGKVMSLIGVVLGVLGILISLSSWALLFVTLITSVGVLVPVLGVIIVKWAFRRSGALRILSLIGIFLVVLAICTFIFIVQPYIAFVMSILILGVLLLMLGLIGRNQKNGYSIRVKRLSVISMVFAVFVLVVFLYFLRIIVETTSF